MRCAMMNRRTEFHAACWFPDERVKAYMANCERAVCLQPRSTVEEMHVRVCEDDTIQRGLISAGMRRCVRRRCVCAYLIIIVSSISSTPWRNRFAKTGGTERTIDAFTEQNSSFSFPLRDLLEPSTSTGRGEPFRFMSVQMSQCRRAEVPSDRCIGNWAQGRSGIPAHAVTSTRWNLALTPFPVRHSLYSTLQGTFE